MISVSLFDKLSVSCSTKIYGGALGFGSYGAEACSVSSTILLLLVELCLTMEDPPSESIRCLAV